LRTEVVDKDLGKKLFPSYPLGTKMVLFDSSFCNASTRSNVQLVTKSIRSVSEKSIKTDERTRPADIIICVTVFKASEFLVLMTVQGRDGCSLNED
jgi:cation diffusion facilitator CzcD-associated flavoprotein CzcO